MDKPPYVEVFKNTGPDTSKAVAHIHLSPGRTVKVIENSSLVIPEFLARFASTLRVEVSKRDQLILGRSPRLSYKRLGGDATGKRVMER
jgi:hypothetical protein